MRRPGAGRLALARAVGVLSRLAGGGGTSAPGKVLVRLDGGAVSELSARLPEGSVLISATNGKTTTATMLAAIMRGAGTTVVHNAAGANMEGGIATALLGAAGRGDSIAGELGLFEVDEAWMGRLVQQLEPRVILLGNLFRDQLDRYGELDTLAASWSEATGAGAGAAAQLVLNADDPLVADLGEARERVCYFGVEDDSLALPELAHAADAKHCRRCGAPYVFEVVYLGHLGHYHCPECGWRRPQPLIYAREVTLEGIRAASFTLHAPAGEARIRLPLPGLYNVYNALGAAAAASALGVPLQSTVDALEGMRAAFGRAETATVAGRELRILLVKNPVGANEVLRTLALEEGEHDVLGVLNDHTADGHDVSWIWDADFELLAGRIRRVTCAGTRAPELAERMKYAGVEPSRIALQGELRTALAEAIEDGGGPLYALPTYTAMLALRKLLGEQAGNLRSVR